MLRRAIAYACYGLICLAISGCATQKPVDPKDPYEVFNRATFKLNKKMDTVIIKPVAYIYIKILPAPVQIGIGNFFDNLSEITNIANDILQFNFCYASYDLSRLLINSTLGIGGLFDVAGAMGLTHRKGDFGQTLYHWGYHESAYLILPFLGPSTVRDTLGYGVDYYGLSIWPWIRNGWEKYTLLGLYYIDTRSKLLRAESVLDTIAVDEYVCMKNAYFQHREYLFKGSPQEDIDADLDLEDDDIFNKSKKENSSNQKEVNEDPLTNLDNSTTS